MGVLINVLILESEAQRARKLERLLIDATMKIPEVNPDSRLMLTLRTVGDVRDAEAVISSFTPDIIYYNPILCDPMPAWLAALRDKLFFVAMVTDYNPEYLSSCLKLNAGAMLMWPFTNARVEQTLDKFLDHIISFSRRALVVSLFSAYPKAGKTSLCLNLGAALAMDKSVRVLLADLFHFEDDLLQQLAISRPDDLPNHYVFTPHASGFDVLQSRILSLRLSNAVVVDAMNRYDIILLELPHPLGRLARTVIRRSDVILVMTSPDQKSVVETRKALDQIDQFSMPEKGVSEKAVPEQTASEKTVIVVNQIVDGPGMTRADIEQQLARKVSFSLPYDSDVAKASVVEGMPIVLQPRQTFWQQKIKLISDAIQKRSRIE